MASKIEEKLADKAEPILGFRPSSKVKRGRIGIIISIICIVIVIIELIRSKKVSILFDLTGYFSDNKISIFKNRAAPIQVSWCGYTNTTGLAEMDYIIADNFLIPKLIISFKYD